MKKIKHLKYYTDKEKWEDFYFLCRMDGNISLREEDLNNEKRPKMSWCHLMAEESTRERCAKALGWGWIWSSWGNREQAPQNKVIGEVRQLGKGKILLTLLDHSKKYDGYSKCNGSHWSGFSRHNFDLTASSRFWGDWTPCNSPCFTCLSLCVTSSCQDYYPYLTPQFS